MLEKSFDPIKTEKEITEKWESQKLFACHPNDDKKPAFSIVIPPPNVTGNLHLGHALDNAIQDVLCRFKRMTGYDVLWQPGTDHAGIATQMMVEKELAKKGISRHDLGREKFMEAVWDWKKKYGGQIIRQLHRLGASCDWDRERFTLDEGLSRAVRKVFVQLYKEGLIYKDKRLVNWDPKLQTAVSDLEVVQKETVGNMWYFRYPVEGSKDEFITIATTRPETMFGDTAVAVSDEDERYKHLIGKNVILPIVNRPIPVIADEHADPTKGTGAVKITPAHDFNDFEVGKRHNLPMINILNNDATLNKNVPTAYQGLTCPQAREKVLEEIKSLGLFDHEEPNPMTIPHGERTGAVIEPLMTDQWFVNAKELAKDAIKAIKEGDTVFVPKNWENTYFEWMNNIQPWCISRQLWWGHQVPVWYGPDGAVFCEETEEEAQSVADKHYGKSVQLTRDGDVLDTWFSSGLWAFSTLGWPDETPELKRYYPTSVLVTGFDIIFFWVARMMMMSMHFMKEVPFRKVYLHGLVRDEKGQKMSKSKGNGIDPLEMCDKYGADALRFSLLIQAGHGRDILMSDARVETYRNFVTKVWNAARFCEMNGAVFGAGMPKEPALSVNKWILSKTATMADTLAKLIDDFSFNEASNAMYHFIWDTFCAWYLEAIKPIMREGANEEIAETKHVCGFVMEQILTMLHPFMPFVTEAIWDETAPRANMLMCESWPVLTAYSDTKAEKGVDYLFDLITAVRSLRMGVNIPPAMKIDLKVKGLSEASLSVLTQNETIFKTLARVNDLDLHYTDDLPKGSISQAYNEATLIIPLEGVVDIEQEKARLRKDIANKESFIIRTKAQLENEAFVSKAPAHIIQDKRNALAEAEQTLANQQKILANLS